MALAAASRERNVAAMPDDARAEFTRQLKAVLDDANDPTLRTMLRSALTAAESGRDINAAADPTVKLAAALIDAPVTISAKACRNAKGSVCHAKTDRETRDRRLSVIRECLQVLLAAGASARLVDALRVARGEGKVMAVPIPADERFDADEAILLVSQLVSCMLRKPARLGKGRGGVGLESERVFILDEVPTPILAPSDQADHVVDEIARKLGRKRERVRAAIQAMLDGGATELPFSIGVGPALYPKVPDIPAGSQRTSRDQLTVALTRALSAAFLFTFDPAREDESPGEVPEDVMESVYAVLEGCTGER